MPSPIPEDLTGQTFGHLVVSSYVGHIRRGPVWLCVCQYDSCGAKVTRTAWTLKETAKRGHISQCGRHPIRRGAKPGDRSLVGKPFYAAYQNAKGRCTNPRHPDYKRYGARGIKFLFTRPIELYAEIGPRPSSRHTLDRKDNNLSYQPGNVRWSTRQQQARNRRKMSSSHYRYKGIRRCYSYSKGGERRFVCWEACVWVKGTRYTARPFATDIEAAQAYDRLALEHFGEFACLNFPHEHSSLPQGSGTIQAA